MSGSEDDRELEMRWCAFLILNSNDIKSHRELFRRVILGNDPPDEDDGRKRPAPRPRPLAPLEPAN